MLELVTLFASAFLSATILPGTSEAVLIGILTLGTSPVGIALAVATVGNTLGSLVNWGIGRFFSQYQNHPRWPVSQEKMEKYGRLFRKYGVWTLFLCWVPFIGDALTLISGVLRANILVVALIVTIAKGVRYLVVAGATLAIL